VNVGSKRNLRNQQYACLYTLTFELITWIFSKLHMNILVFRLFQPAAVGDSVFQHNCNRCLHCENSGMPQLLEHPLTYNMAIP
jgi:hypothetical protein